MSTRDMEFDEDLGLDCLLGCCEHSAVLLRRPLSPGGASPGHETLQLCGGENKQGCPVPLRLTGRRGCSHQSEGSWQGCGLEEDQTPGA